MEVLRNGFQHKMVVQMENCFRNSFENGEGRLCKGSQRFYWQIGEMRWKMVKFSCIKPSSNHLSITFIAGMAGAVLDLAWVVFA